MVAATITPILLRSIADEVVDVLQGSIISAEYPLGQRLVERELTARFGVSAIPIREALHELESRGLVTVRHNHSCSAISLSPEELREIAKLRKTLEPKVMQWAAARMPAVVENIKKQLDRVTSAAKAKDVSRAVGSLFVSGLRRVKESGALAARILLGIADSFEDHLGVEP